MSEINTLENSVITLEELIRRTNLNPADFYVRPVQPIVFPPIA